jgi:hypothetical protein
MSIKVTQNAITFPLNSDEYAAVLVAGLMDVRERTAQAEPTHKDDIAFNALLIAALDVVLAYYGVDRVS